MSSSSTQASPQTAPDGASVWGPTISVVVLLLANLITYACNEHSWVFRNVLHPRLGMRPLLFISNRAAGISRHARPMTYWAFDLLDPQHLVHSHCLNSLLLVALHAATFIYFVLTVIVDVVIEYYNKDHHSGVYGEWTTFLTNWSISLLGLAGLVALINTLRQLDRQRRQHGQQQQELAQQQGPQQHQGPSSHKALPRFQQQHGSSKGITSNPGSHSPGSAGGLRGASWRDSIRSTDNNNSNAGSAQCVPGSAGSSAGHETGQTSQQQQQPAVAGHPAGVLHPRSSTSNSGSSSSGGNSAGGATCCLGGGGNAAEPAAHGHINSHNNGSSSSSSREHDTVVIVQGDAGSATSSADSNNSTALQRQLQQQWDWLSCLHCQLMEVATTAAFFVAFWYWVGIVAITGSGYALSGGTLMAHAGNVVVALLQVVLTRLPIVSYHFQVLLWYATLYSVFVWIYGGSTDIWRYGLDFQRAKPAGAFCIIPAITFIMFLLWFFAAKIREGVLCAAHKKAMRKQARQPPNPGVTAGQHQLQPGLQPLPLQPGIGGSAGSAAEMASRRPTVDC